LRPPRPSGCRASVCGPVANADHDISSSVWCSSSTSFGTMALAATTAEDDAIYVDVGKGERSSSSYAWHPARREGKGEAEAAPRGVGRDESHRSLPGRAEGETAQ
jgi:hypothetical protein